MRLAQYRQSVRNRNGSPPTDQFQTDPVVDENINIAIQSVAQEARWPWQEARQTITITDTTGDVAVPPDWRATRAIIVDQHEVMVVSPTEVFMWPSSASGLPQIVAVIDRTLTFRPVPTVGTTITHIYYRTPTLLVQDDDVTNIPDEYAPAIIAKACELLAIREDDRAAAAAHAAEYGEWIRRMRGDKRRTTGPIVPRQRPGGWV